MTEAADRSSLRGILDLAKKRGAEAEIFWSTREALSLTSRARRPKESEHVHAAGIGIRLLHNGCVSFLFATRPEDAGRMVPRRLEGRPVGRSVNFRLPGPAPCHAPSILDPALEGFGMTDLGGVLKQAAEMISRDAGSRNMTGLVSLQKTNIRLFNTSGIEAFYRKTLFGAGFRFRRAGKSGPPHMDPEHTGILPSG